MRNSLARVIQSCEEPLDITRQILEACAEVKALSPVVLDVSKITDCADYFVIVSARSDRQVEGTTNRVIETLGRLGVEPNSVEGLDTSQWVIVDYGDVVLHVFYEGAREKYNLEALWCRGKRVMVTQDSDPSAL